MAWPRCSTAKPSSALSFSARSSFNEADIDNVRAIQAKYTATPLSGFLKQPAPPALPLPDFPAFEDDAFKLKAFSYLNFLMQFAPTVPVETELRAKFARIGSRPGVSLRTSEETVTPRLLPSWASRKATKRSAKQRDEIGKETNGWRIGSAFGDGAFYHGDYTLRAAAALAGIYGNDAVEALYPLAVADSTGAKLNGSKSNYTITFPADAYPPVNAFWSVTMYDGKTQLLIENPINRYLINSPMLPDMKKNADRIADDVHPEQIARQGEGSKLAAGPRWSDLHGHASLLA